MNSLKNTLIAFFVFLLGPLANCLGDFDKPLAPPVPMKAAPKKPSAAPAAKAVAKKPPEQSYAQAWEVICYAERRSAADPNLTRRERGRIVAAWIVENLKNKRARYWFIDLGKVEKERRQAVFQQEAKQAGITDCPLAELLFSEDKGSGGQDATKSQTPPE